MLALHCTYFLISKEKLHKALIFPTIVHSIAWKLAHIRWCHDIQVVNHSLFKVLTQQFWPSSGGLSGKNQNLIDSLLKKIVKPENKETAIIRLNNCTTSSTVKIYLHESSFKNGEVTITTEKTQRANSNIAGAALLGATQQKTDIMRIRYGQSVEIDS